MTLHGLLFDDYTQMTIPGLAFIRERVSGWSGFYLILHPGFYLMTISGVLFDDYTQAFI